MIALVRRRTELGLVVLASLFTAGAYALAALGKTATLPADIGPFLGLVLGLLVVAHLATRRLAPGADGLLLPLAGLLNGIGYVFIARLDEAARDEGSLAGLQAVWTALGVAAYAGTLLFVRRARDLQGYKYLAMAGGVGLLLLPLAPVLGQTINGARIWVELGPVGFQPGEFAKIALAVFFAGYLADNRQLLGLSALHPKYLGPVLIAWGASLMVMFFQKDLGSSLLFFALFLAMLWIATERLSYLAIGFGL
ncbi:MAG TPA: FtsW/RodA/SpoVE family cell cycle protein, partial [Acidimicrobiales bacterium]|nr:FtsW/RodA/SpoVE family cell cycle protein [Acidimicrobiales bacterium]